MDLSHLAILRILTASVLSKSFLLSYVFQHGSADNGIIRDEGAKIKIAVRRGGERAGEKWSAREAHIG